ncbi:MAG: hypothetical protein IIA87_00335 [Nanoarchaeota archaeon]|nr:hypothetical protein [Nanoarchaeota archaeon]
MRRISFIIVILGIFVLLVLLIFPPIEIEEIESLDEIEVNEKISLSGEVIDERIFEDFKILKIGEIEVVCNCPIGESYLGKNVSVIGLVEEFNERKQIRVLRLLVE